MEGGGERGYMEVKKTLKQQECKYIKNFRRNSKHKYILEYVFFFCILLF